MRVIALEKIAALSQQARTSAESALDRILAAPLRGDLRADDITVRRLTAADAADKAGQAQRDLATARGDLNRLLGLPPEAQLTLAASEPAGDPPGDAEALFARARAERLDLKALEAGYASQEAVLRKAVLDQFPNLQLTLSRSQDTAKNQTFGPAVNFTLPLWNRNQGGIAIAKATREQLRAEYDARLFATRADIAELVDTLALEQRQRSDAAVQASALDRAALAAEAAAARGDIAHVTAEAARQSATDKILALIGLDQSIAEQTTALELAVGVSLSP